MSDAPASKSRVLVVDDSRLIQKAVLKMLGGEFDVVTADDGVEAWTIVQNDASIDVVFADLDMPRMDGYELIRTIRGASESGIQNLPVIVVTGVKEDETARMQALQLGATDFITKPFTTSDLLARARAHARHQRITLQLQAQTTLDALSGLLNKAGFTDRLQQDISYARRHGQALTLACLEIDNLRGLFLKHGKESAERLVTHVAQLLRANIRMEDSAGRIGLGSFALSVPGGEQAGVERMLERVRGEITSTSPLSSQLSTAVISDLGPIAQEALDQCQSRLVASRASSAAAAAAPAQVAAKAAPPALALPAAAPAVPTVPTVARPAPLMSAPEAGVAPPQLDSLLRQIEQGQPQPAVAAMPQILHRLEPLLRLLNPMQRAQLARYLLQLGK